MKPPKNYWASNIRYLRKRQKMTQAALAEKLGMPRSRLNGHENGVIQNPGLEDLLRLSEYLKISVDTLIKTDLSKLSEFKLRQLEAGNDAFVSGRNLRILPVTVDKDNQEQMEYVPIAGKMGYRSGYNDPEYIAGLPRFSLPNLPKGKTYRIFTGTGDSMWPIRSGTDFITEYVTDWKSLKDTPCVVILNAEGADFVIKLVTYRKEDRSFLLRSLNESFAPYSLPADEILEIWKYYRHITDQLPEEGHKPSLERLTDLLHQMQSELRELRDPPKEGSAHKKYLL